MSTVYTNSTGNAPTGVSINDTRRIFNFGERVAELAPAQSPFFVYHSKVAKKSTDDPVFKFKERRHQWQRRNFEVAEDLVLTATGTPALSDFAPVDTKELKLTVHYDKYGKTVTEDTDPEFLIAGQTITVEAVADFTGSDDPTTDVRVTLKISKVEAGGEIEASVLSIVSASSGAVYSATDFTASQGTVTYEDGDRGQVIGSAWAESSTDPDGWKDAISTSEGYCQIFKTAISMFSGTALATRYRGVANEYKRVWQEKLMEHKMDIEHAMLFGIGTANGTDDTGESNIRYSWGILPYTEQFGNTYSFSYANSGYDAFLDAMEGFFAPETGNSGSKLVLASRKVITYLNKLGDNGFLNNTVGSSQYRLDVTNIPGSFGHNVTKINTIYGDLHFVAEPLLRGMWEDYAIAIDLKNVAYRPLIGNGVSRDTHIITNVQNNNVDGRKDIIMTEAGLEISLPETHAILKFS
jgi:hypothetical protein